MTTFKHNHYRFVPGPDENAFPYSLYDSVAQNCFNDDILVECGVGFGRTTCYMMEALHHFKKQPKFYVFDLFGEIPGDGEPLDIFSLTPWGEPLWQWKARGGDFLDEFIHAIEQSPARKYLKDYAQFPSWTICNNFADESVSFVMLNVSRKKENVLKELRGWWPKLKRGGKVAMIKNGDEVLQATDDFTLDLDHYTLGDSGNSVVIQKD